MDSFFSDKESSVDNLTNLYTRDVMNEYMTHLVSQDIPFSVALVDIDNFKYTNDSYGHIAGDKILNEIAERIRQKVGADGAVGRFGGDEFVVVLKNIVEYDKLWNICHNILVNMSEVEISNFSGLYVTVTIGLARFPENEKNPEKLLNMADKALYRGKTKGRNCFIIYLPEKHANIVLKKEKEKQLSSMYLHSVVFNNLSKPSLKEGIENLFNFLSSYFMIDHICIQTEDKILFEKLHLLSKTKEFKIIPLQLIQDKINKSIGMFYVNEIKQVLKANHIKLYDSLKEQQISSICLADISYAGKSYGFIRADMTGTETSCRIWQHYEMDILQTAAKMIATVLNFTNLSLENL